MYLSKISNDGIEKFIKGCIKDKMIENNQWEENYVVLVEGLERISDREISVHTKVTDGRYEKKHSLRLTNYKAYNNTNYKDEEMVDLSQKWAKFVFESLAKQDVTLAEKFKEEYTNYITTEKDGNIQMAQDKYDRLVI